MTARTLIPDPKAAGTTLEYKCQLQDENGNPIPAAQLATLTLTLLDTYSRAVANSVSDVSVLNTGRGTVDSQGNVVITLTPADTAMLIPGDVQEFRSLILIWTYGSGKKGDHEVAFILTALSGS